MGKRRASITKLKRTKSTSTKKQLPEHDFIVAQYVFSRCLVQSSGETHIHTCGEQKRHLDKHMCASQDCNVSWA